MTDQDAASEDPDDLPDPNQLHWTWRTVAAAVGAAGLTFGTLAIFVTDVEAGPVALLAVGLIFAVMAMAGIVPWRIKFGDTEMGLLHG